MWVSSTYMVSFDNTTVGLGVGRGQKPHPVRPGERGKFEMLMAAANWSDSVMSLSVM